MSDRSWFGIVFGLTYTPLPEVAIYEIIYSKTLVCCCKPGLVEYNSPMNRFELGIPLKDIRIPHVQHLLQTSRAVHCGDGIDMEHAVWFDYGKHPAVILETDITPRHQGWEGITYGGLIAKIIDGVAGFAGVLAAARKGKMALAEHLEVDFLRPIPVYTAVATIAEVQAIEGRDIICSARIVDAEETKTFAKGTLELRMVDGISPSGVVKSNRVLR